MLMFLYLKAVKGYSVNVRHRERNDSQCIPGSRRFLIRKARLISFTLRHCRCATELLCGLLAVCLNINNYNFHTCLLLQFVKTVGYNIKLISYLLSRF